MDELTHLDEEGRAVMVDVSGKAATARTAIARGEVRMAAKTLAAIRDGNVPKGDVLAAARIAGIMAAKRTPDLIPLCHTLLLTHASVEFDVDEKENRVVITATVRCTGQTGVEMEALTAVSVAALTIYDMAKALEKGMVIADICLTDKRGGKSGDYTREKEEAKPASKPQAKPKTSGNKAKRVAKYEPLFEHLKALPAGDREETYTFSQLEKIIGADLPEVAVKDELWWLNDAAANPQAGSWLDAGWRVYSFDRAKRSVRFRRSS